MLETLWEQFQTLLGLGAEVSDVDAVQMAFRTIVIYVITLTLVRLGSKRFLSEASAFDVIVSIMIGSIMSRAINGSAPFIPTLFAGIILLGLHWLFAIVAYRTDWFGSLVKGRSILLIKDGEVQRDEMRRASITSKDLTEALRLRTNQSDPGKVKRAYLERNGSISIIPYEQDAHVLEVSVRDGVQTVRIEIGRPAPEEQSANNTERNGLSRE